MGTRKLITRPPVTSTTSKSITPAKAGVHLWFQQNGKRPPPTWIPARAGMTGGWTGSLDKLEGKRIGIVSNEQWQAFRMLPMLKELLEKDFPGITVLPVDAYPQGNALIGTEETAAMVKKSGVDAVIVGNAA